MTLTFFMVVVLLRKSRRLRENILMRIYEDVDMNSPDMASAKAGLDALVDELKVADQSKVRNGSSLPLPMSQCPDA